MQKYAIKIRKMQNYGIIIFFKCCYVYLSSGCYYLNFKLRKFSYNVRNIDKDAGMVSS